MDKTSTGCSLEPATMDKPRTSPIPKPSTVDKPRTSPIQNSASGDTLDVQPSVTSKELPCPGCDKSFVSQQSLDSHIKHVHGGINMNAVERNFKCAYCPSTCKYEISARAHIRKFHKFKCMKCKQRFRTAYDLQGHMKNDCPENEIKKISHIDYDLKADAKAKRKTCTRIGMIAHKKTCEEKGTSTNKCSPGEADNLSQQMLDIDENKMRVEHVAGCADCNKTFMTIYDLRVHERKEHWEPIYKVYSCNRCPRKFKAQIALTRHYQQQHKTELATTTNKCPHCRATYLNQKKLEKHINEFHVECVAVCTNCNKTFKTIHSLRVHKRQEHSESIYKVYSCRHCPREFESKTDLEIHYKDHPNDLYPCPKCEKNFREIHILKCHVKQHLNKRDYLCSECGKGYITKKQLMVHHVQRHGHEGRFVCEMCGKRFEFYCTLKKHINIYHLGQKNYNCDICSRKFASKEGLKIHIDSTHLHHCRARPYKCKFCGKHFAQRGNLKEHGWIHTGEKPYKCTVCGVRFRHKKTLQYHMTRHTGQRPYKCVRKYHMKIPQVQGFPQKKDQPKKFY